MLEIKSENSHVDRMSKIAPLSEKEKKLLATLHTRKQYKKNSVIDQQGTISKAVYYLNKGILSMEYQHGTKVFVRDFIFKDSPALVYPSFYLEEPSRYSIKAVTDCDVWELTKENFEIGKKKIPSLEIIAFKITNLFHQNIERRFESMITKSAEHRYLELVENHPRIIQSISLKMIASYLGITDVALSRIRSRLSKKVVKSY
jgi:CRP-like cAMP-binding protein